MFLDRSRGWALCLSLLCALVIAGCGGGGGDDGGGGGDDGGDSGGGGNKTCSVPKGLIDNAGPDRYVKTGSLVQLDGSASRGKNGDDPDSYAWSFSSRPDGSRAKLSSKDSAAPQFTADLDGKYVIRLIIDGVKCEKATDSVKITATPTGKNSKPNANAGSDQRVVAGDKVNLSGADSFDPDGSALDYVWQFTSRPKSSDAKLKGKNTVSPSFTADVAGTYAVGLQVGDRSSLSDRDEVRIVARKKTAPTANAGSDQSVRRGEVVHLDGSQSSDPGERLINYKWHLISKPDGSNVTLNDNDTVRPTFQPDKSGSYVASLVVDNGDETSKPDRVIVFASSDNSQPVANAGSNQNVHTGVMVELNGKASSDANNDKLAYRWSLSSTPSDSRASLTGASTPTPKFTPDAAGQYVVQLVVGDGQLKSEPDSVVVTASAGNSAPVANAGLDQRVNLTETVDLDGTDSTDADNNELSYDWHLVSRPADSSVSLNDSESAKPSFTADKSGFYVAALTVSDGQVNSARDQVVIKASPALALFVDRSDNGSDYEKLSDSGNSHKIELEAGTENALLNRFRVKALGRDYTVSNVTLTNDKTDGGQAVKPYFDGLSKGDEINAGDQQDFAIRLRSVPDEQGTFTVKLQFTSQPGSRHYYFTYNIEVK